MPTYDEILGKHAELAAQEIAAEKAKDAEAREYETLSEELAGMQARFSQLIKNPTMNAGQIAELKEILASKTARLFELEKPRAQARRQAVEAEYRGKGLFVDLRR